MERSCYVSEAHSRNHMAKELLKTPLVEVRWCKLNGPARANKFDPDKNPEWSVEALLNHSDKTHMAFVEAMEAKFDELHPKKRKHTSWLPIKPDKDKPRDISVCRFKIPQFTYRDGNTSEGPTIYDSRKNPWNPEKLIGNGSKLIIAFDIYAWEGPTGAGMTFQPRMAQVVDLVEYEGRADAEATFETVDGGYVVDEDIPF